MREIKVLCDCGQKFKFDVEPVNGKMPYAVVCPVCGADGTAKANAVLASEVIPPASHISSSVHAGIPPASVPPPPVVASAPASIAAVPTSAAPAPLSNERPKLRLSSSAPVADASPSPAETPVAGAPRPAGRPTPVVRAPSGPLKADSGFTRGFARGVMGALVGAIIGGAIYYGIMGYTGFRIGLMAIAAGFLAGLGGRFIGKEGSTELGVIAATFTIVAVLGAQYGVAWRWWHEYSAEEEVIFAEMFEAMRLEAAEVLKAVPTGSDQEIRAYLAKQDLEDPGDRPEPGQITPEEIKLFREESLPMMKDLASGKLTFDGWKKQIEGESARADAARTEEEKDEEDRNFKWYFMLILLNKVNLLSLAGGAGLAYKMNTNGPE